MAKSSKKKISKPSSLIAPPVEAPSSSLVPSDASNTKHIIVCIDGTWNNYIDIYSEEDKNYWTNVQWFRALLNEKDAHGRHQIVFYTRGLGTLHYIDQWIGGLLADGIDYQILDAYISICDNYVPGDKISLFGFSRGAVAARALAGMISQCGLLRPNKIIHLPEVWRYFLSGPNTAPHPGQTSADAFEKLKDWSYPDRTISCVGVWDSVWGAPSPEAGYLRTFYDWARSKPAAELRFKEKDLRFSDLFLSSNIKRAYQALAINERRQIFEYIPWKKRSNASDQIIRQVWFPGDHPGVGGGYKDRGLANISLRWMINRAREADLRFYDDAVEKNIKPGLMTTHHDASAAWGNLSKADRKSLLNETEIEGEHLHISAIALYQQDINLFVTEDTRKVVKYDILMLTSAMQGGGEKPKIPKVLKRLVEDYDDLSGYLDQLNIKSEEDLAVKIISESNV